MKMLTKLLGAVVCATMAASTASAATMGMMTSRPGSIYYNEGTAIAKVVSDVGINLTIQSATSPTLYLPLVAQGGATFGLANMQEPSYALNGEAWFDGHKYPDLRVAALLMPNRATFFVRKDSNIHTIADLKGHKMPDGYTAGKTILPQIDAMLATAGLTRKDVVPVQVQSVVAGVQSFMSGEVDGFTFAMDGSIVKEADAKVGGLRALPIADTPEALEAARKYWPTGYFAMIKPESGVAGVLEPINIMAYPMGIVTSTHASDDDVYRLVKALYENADKLSPIFPGFKDFDREHMGDRDRTGNLQFHPGAAKFYKEIGLW